MLPHTDGLEICKTIRSHPDLNELPIIFLTARAAETDRVIGLELGANDYLVKPFFVRELIARIKLQVRQKNGDHSLLAHGETGVGPAALRGAAFRLEGRPDRHRISPAGVLMNRPSRVFTRDELLDQVWGHDRNVAERAVDVCVLRLRQKLGEDPTSPRWVHSVRGFGYTFDPERVTH